MKYEIKSVFSIEEESGEGCFILIVAFFIGFGLNWVVFSYFSTLGVIVYNIVGFTILLLIFAPDARKYCENCHKFVYPIVFNHICFKEDKDYDEMRDILQNITNEKEEQMKLTIAMLKKKRILRGKKEIEIFKSNLISFYYFDFIHNYKYSIIAMGSIIEFLLFRSYSELEENPNKKSNFHQLCEWAIEENFINQKKRWQIIQSHLRDFRNYVHIDKEVKSDDLDFEWYQTIKPVFEKILILFST